MNFLQQLFKHHPHPAGAPENSYIWPGHSGTEYQFHVHSLNTVFKPLPGVYIYAKQLPDGDWVPIYISQTRDLHQRLEGHVRLHHGIENGATHLHAHYCSAGQAARCTEEHDLIARWQPVCNDPVET